MYPDHPAEIDKRQEEGIRDIQKSRMR